MERPYILASFVSNLMHILHLTPYYAPAYAFGGVVRAVEGMARALTRRGHTITILTTDALDQRRRYGVLEEVMQGVRVVRQPNVSPRLRGRFNLSTPRRMRQMAQKLLPEVDVVHCHEFRTVENLLVTPVAAQLDKPLILSPHGTLALDTGRSQLKLLWDRVLSSAVALRFDHIIGLSQAEINMVQALWPSFGQRRVPVRFSMIPNGIDLSDFADLPGRDEFRRKYALGGAAIVLFMGRLHARKGLDVLVKAFRQMNDGSARLVLAGPDEGMRETLIPLLDENVILTGYLEGQERLAAFAAADIFALPATGEGLSMAVLEAMGAGLPVILSPGCNFPEAALHDAGIEVEPQIEPLAAALKTLLVDTEKRRTMGQRARQLVQERFTWDAVAAQLEEVYRQYE